MFRVAGFFVPPIALRFEPSTSDGHAGDIRLVRPRQFMNIGITGASGFLGRHLRDQFARGGHSMRGLTRNPSMRTPAPSIGAAEVQWVTGSIDEEDSIDDFVRGLDAVVHAAWHTPGKRFVGGEGDLLAYYETNMLGTLRLMRAADRAGVSRFVFISTGAVHGRTIEADSIDETHPLWPTSVYGAAKAAVETAIAATASWSETCCFSTLRPTTIYGVDDPVEQSRYWDLISEVWDRRTVTADGGGKVVHATDIAAACECLFSAASGAVRGETFNCTGGFVAKRTVAELAAQIAGVDATVGGSADAGKQMDTSKLQALGFAFHQETLLRETVRSLVEAKRKVGDGG